MAPDDRRAALIRATIPLLHEHGLDVSTRQIAEAAGVAEGTIFGVFENKNKLVTVSVLQALDPQPTIDAFEAIDRGLSLRERLTIAADMLMQRFLEHAQLMGAMRKLIMTGGEKEPFHKMAHDRERMQAALAELIQPDAAILRRSPGSTARLLLLYCGARTFGPFGDPDPFDSQEAVSLLLDGLLIRQDDNRGAQSTC
jgi:AcrR family transcriptional regulator